ncbi:hypothetical protein LINGRAHAP2_LOCUS33029 [Linum grandiflorum]
MLISREAATKSAIFRFH